MLWNMVEKEISKLTKEVKEAESLVQDERSKEALIILDKNSEETKQIKDKHSKELKMMSGEIEGLKQENEELNFKVKGLTEKIKKCKKCSSDGNIFNATNRYNR